MPPDLTNRVLVFEDDFSNGFNRYTGEGGLWATDSRTGGLKSNSNYSVNLSGSETRPDGSPLGLDPFAVSNGVLTIGSGELSATQKADVASILTQTGELASGSVSPVDYYTGRMSTRDTWSQTYGYFEITARIPEGKGQWPAFWLVSEKPNDWPPEITALEAYGRNTDGTGAWYNDRFSNGVHFDSTTTDGSPVDITITNPYDLDENGDPRPATDRSGVVGQEVYTFSHPIDPLDEFGSDIYTGFWTWAVDWGPQDIVFYFGPDRDNLVETYRTPTPDDHHGPMVLIANNQVGTDTGWFGEPGFSDFEVGDDFEINSISVYAHAPQTSVQSGPGGPAGGIAGDVEILDSVGDDTLRLGEGFQTVRLTGGADTVHVTRGTGHKIFEGFGANDTLVLEGFRFSDTAAVEAALTQVGPDVWLSQGAFGSESPQTIIFRDATPLALSGRIQSLWPETPDIWADKLLIDGTLIGDSDGDGEVVAPEVGGRLTDAGQAGLVFLGSSRGDTYTIYSPTATIVEAPNGGVDTLFANFSQVLPENVENLVSIAQRDGRSYTGNAADNRMTGSIYDEIIAGVGGNDLIDLSAGGADSVAVAPGDGNDVLIGFGPDDTLVLQGFVFENWLALQGGLQTRGADTELDLGGGQVLTFRDTAPGQITETQVSAAYGEQVLGSVGDDMLRTGGVVSIVDLSLGGSDTVEVIGNSGITAVDGFGADDTLILEGWTQVSASALLSSAVQAGPDLWFFGTNLPDGTMPTLILRDTTAASVTAAQIILRWSVTPSYVGQPSLRDDDGDGVVTAPEGGAAISDSGPSFPGGITLVGGVGSDLFTVFKNGTVVTDANNQDADSIQSKRSTVLPEGIENLISTAKAHGRVFTGNDADNRITGSSYSEVLNGGAGDDLIDLTLGGADSIIIAPGDGDDVILGFSADDVLVLNDFVFASWAALQTQLSTSGADTVLSLGPSQTVTFRDTNIAQITEAQVDATYDGSSQGERPTDGIEVSGTYNGSHGVDVLLGLETDDRIRGRNGDDELWGGDGDDQLQGQGDDDALHGEAGDDTLDGGLGLNTLTGGAGADTFRIGDGAAAQSVTVEGDAFDSFQMITDFDLADGDELFLSGFDALIASENLGNRRINSVGELADLIAATSSAGSDILKLTADDGTLHGIFFGDAVM